MGVDEHLQVFGRSYRRPLGDRCAQFGQHFAHPQLVLCRDQRVGYGMHGNRFGGHGPQHFLRHVFVIEGDDVDFAGELQHRFNVFVVTHRGRGQPR